MNLKKRVSELKNMLNGSAAERSNDELWTQTVAVIDEMADRLERISLNQAKILDYVEALDDDLSTMESQLNNPGSPDEDDEDYDLGSNSANDHPTNIDHEMLPPT